MINRSQARTLVEDWVAAAGSKTVPLAILDEATLERPYGWVFFYQSVNFIKTGDYIHALAGNAPLLILKETGTLIQLGTAKPIEDYLSDYEARADMMARRSS